MTGTVAHAELPRRQQPAVAGNDAVVAVDQDRVGPAELADRGGDLRHLRIAVRPGVLGEGDQSRGRTVLHRESANVHLDVIRSAHIRFDATRRPRDFAINIEVPPHFSNPGKSAVEL